MMSNLIQKAIDQTHRAQYGVCIAEAVHALDELGALLDEVARLPEKWRKGTPFCGCESMINYNTHDECADELAAILDK
jgi:hypothetical protein